ncbi:MAG: hypothetical protein GEV28_22400 [Actinophytocola sp.]|uniref:hypothetical protein n=1 Tax=Actinophytocola sp. TaxID=1872138 RepID=UPI0013229176|nr:hypothetical protein [Actinophytocola sp.]MPZ82992.1 hypothetical protein [Actinophytocola sp.]
MSKPGRGPQSERNFLTKIAVGSGFVITWFLGTLAAELLGGQANETSIGQFAGRFLLVALVVVVPLTTLVWAGIKLWKWRHPSPPEPPPPPEVAWPAEPEPAAWRPPGPIYDRDDEVAATVRTLLATGVAVVCGARDVGTSAVAEAAVQSLINDRRIADRDVARVDLRSRSSRTPDDARATAGRILSMFRQDEPANGTPKVLANAAERLHDVLAKQYSVLLLDNVAVPDEIEWLIPQWTERNNRQPWLVIAGETAIESVVPGSGVAIAPLSTDGMREIWHADTDTMPKEPARPLMYRRRRFLPRWVRDLLRPRRELPRSAPLSTPDPIDALVAVCRGRPRAIKAVARETTGTDREAEVLALLASMNTDENNPLVGIWRAVLLRTEDSLSPEAAWLLHALAVIPVTALTREAIAALVTAHAPDAGSSDALPAPFEELRVRDFVEEVRNRYRLPLEIRWAITGQADQPDVDKARVAVPALVRHHADRVVRRANQLDVRSVGARAAAWLHEEEPTLRPLFSPEYYQDGEVLLAVIDDLARIAGALEYWYVREQQADGLLKVSAALGELADRAQRRELSALAAARKATAYRMVGQRAAAEEQLALVAGEARAASTHDLGTELVTRLHVEKALLGLAGGESTRDGAEHPKVRRSLEEIADNKRHPGAGIAMINLGAMHLAENSPGAALEYLERAEAMARERQDTSCQAQAVELQGIALSGSDLHEAVSRWQEAKQLFKAIGEEQGRARCLQHLGAAALVDETVAARLADGTRGAVPLLQESKQLRAGQPDTALVDEYLRAADGDMGPDKPAYAPK